MPSASSASAGSAFFTSAEAATSAWQVIAPITTSLPSTLMPFSAATAPRSIRSLGAASRSLSEGSSDMPPATRRGSLVLLSLAAASFTSAACW